jgi:pimeloyl-ACP methyl ester carboxylesterase
LPLLEPSGIWYADHRSATNHRTPVLMIHGAGGSHLDWPAELRRMPEANAITPDLPGHGRSKGEGRDTISAYAADMVILLDALKLERVIVLGYSMGAAVALMMALHHKARVAGIILIGGGAQMKVNPAILGGLKIGFEITVRMMLDWQWAEGTGEQIKRLVLRRMLESDPDMMLNDYKAVDGFDVRDRLAQIHTPTLIIGGTADRMVSFEQSELLHRHIAGSKLVSIEGGGHLMVLEQAQTVADAVQTWLMETYP